MRRWNEVNRLGRPHLLTADALVAIVVWAIALVYGGTFALRVAEVVTVGVGITCLRRGLPRGRADESYIVVLRQRFSSSPAAVAGDSSLPNSMTRRLLLVVAATLCIAVQGAFPKAPNTDSLPVAASLSVVASASGGSQVDTAHDQRRYRYIAISGPKGMPDSVAMTIQMRSLVRAGWNCDVTRAVRAKPRGEAIQLIAHPCPARASRGGVTLTSPDRALRVDINPVATLADAAQEADATPLEGAKPINGALTGDRPVLWTLLQDEN